MEKKIWITGASSGIGKAVAEKFAKEGWKVAISARRKELLDEMAKNPNIFSFPLDVTQEDQVNETFLKIIENFNDLDICFFCSGTYNPKNEQEIDTNKIKSTMNTNFIGIVNCVKSAESFFKNKKSGQISIVSSIAGYMGLPNSTGYGPSKAALNNLAESLYFDFGRHNVRVSLVSPGFIKTPMTDKNNFKMPFIKSPEFAAQKIYNGLIKSNAFEITFPKQLTMLFKLFKILPNRIYLFLISKLVKR